ncbi:MAG: NADH:flavin oxidoreductase [Pseudomonadota bacterium]
MSSSDPLLQPFEAGKLRLKNRIVSTPHAPAYAEDGMPKERYQLYHEEKAKGGLAMTMFGGSSCVGPDSPSVFGQLNVGTDEIIPWFQEFSARIHRHDCAIMCQISHLGRRTTWNQGDWLPVVAPSRVREPAHRAFPKEMDQADIDRIIGYYVDAALRCREGGLDGVEILSNGHLPGQFLNPNTNLRTDKYGGSLENRCRFMLEMLSAVREAAGPDFTVSLRAEMDSHSPDGIGTDEALQAFRIIEREGLIDLLNLNVGRNDTDLLLAMTQVPSMWQKLAPWLQLAGHFKQELGLPVIHACRISDLATARYAVEEGLVDLVGMTRAHIADPHIVNKLTAGEEDRIRTCVGAGYCIDRIYFEGEAFCIQNVATGREKVLSHTISKSGGQPKQIVIVGGGPAGLEAARVCAERGHNVVLFEASGELGGQVLLAAKAAWRGDLIGVIDWLKAELDHLRVTIRYHTLAGGVEVEAEAPDVVIIATGGLPDTEVAPGGEHCLSVWDVLSGEPVSGDVIVYDDSGQHQAPSCADHIAGREGVSVEFLTPDRHAAAEMGNTNAPFYMRHFYQKGVAVTPDHRLASIEPAGNRLKATFTNEFGGPDIERTADHIIVEHGTLPNDELFHELKGTSSNGGVTDFQALLADEPQEPAGHGYALYRIGDAVASRNIHAALFDARRLCKDL